MATRKKVATPANPDLIKSKAAIVLSTQGVPAGLVDSLTEPQAERLAVHVNDDLQMKYAVDARLTIAEYHESLKATVEE